MCLACIVCGFARFFFVVLLVSHLRFSFLFVLATSSLVVLLSFAYYFITCCLLHVSPLAAWYCIACCFWLRCLLFSYSPFCHLLFPFSSFRHLLFPHSSLHHLLFATSLLAISVLVVCCFDACCCCIIAIIFRYQLPTPFAPCYYFVVCCLSFHCLFCCLNCSWYFHPWFRCAGGKVWSIWTNQLQFFLRFSFLVYYCSIKCLKSCVFMLQELYILYNISTIDDVFLKIP